MSRNAIKPVPMVKFKAGAALAIVMMVQACGGGGNSEPISTPRPAPSSTPSPVPPSTPTTTPTQTTNFSTKEYRDSDGPEFHAAIKAWEAGATGNGTTIAVIDTGIDMDSPEFAGRLHPESQDVAGNRSVEAEDDHGTHVSMIAAAARDDRGILGVAFDADVLALRADTPGTCVTEATQGSSPGCTFSNQDIARGIDVAVNAGATVINLSLGGDASSQQVFEAVKRASAAGVVIVVASGNYGDGSDPAFDRFQPTPFASSLRQAGGDNVILVGSIDEGGNFSRFANPAGDEADWFISARGERICCVYEGGEIFLSSDANGEYVTLISGTSFAAPQVAGAVALLKQAFPNLTGAEMVELLLESARDAGDPGTDTTYGRGVLDIAKAFQPAGAMSVAGTQLSLSRGEAMAIGSPAMGDAFQQIGLLETIATDKYERAYSVDLGRAMRDGAYTNNQLSSALSPLGRQVSAGNANLAVAFTVAAAQPGEAYFDPVSELTLSSGQSDIAQVMAGRIAARIAPSLQFGVAVREGAGGLIAQLEGAGRPSFLIAGSTAGRSPLSGRDVVSVATRYTFQDGAGLGLLMERGESVVARGESFLSPPQTLTDPSGFIRIGSQIDGDVAGLAASLGLDWLREDGTILGGWFDSTFGTSSGNSIFLTGSLGHEVGAGWAVNATYRKGWTHVGNGGLVGSTSTIESAQWSFDVDRAGVFTPKDRLAFRLSQPLRVESGGINLRLPTAYSYATRSATFADHLLALSPSSRELVGEARWSGPFGYGWGGVSLFYRANPHHRSDTKSDEGIAVNYQMTF